MASVYRDVNSVVAHLDGVHLAVIAERDVLAARARAKFASHDNPGGHEITTQDDKVDALVSLEGPAPLSVEYGHGAYTTKSGRHVGASTGLHILTGLIP